LLTSQLNRAADQPGAEPSLRHLKDCSTIEHESRAVLILKRLNPNLAAEAFPVACTLAKNKGRMGTCQLVLNTKASRFETMTGG
jgi:replicative DNA helicase